MLKSHILIVDDSRTIRFQIKQSFESEDQETFNFTEAEDGHQAFRWLVRQSANTLPDLIILDRNMPNLNGDEFIKIRRVMLFLECLWLLSNWELYATLYRLVKSQQNSKTCNVWYKK
jgi:DNA-binding NarL/FixJ family response regulator